ncbi:MAG TPA: hypothetical protein DIC60_08365 [Lachnospiraceae bacterium]|nr:hypothetical protein [Lachnospiraceae bacterium]
MDFINDIFVDENVENLNTIIYSLKKGIPVFNIYLICIDNMSENTAHIMSSSEYFSKINSKKQYKIIGIAVGKYGANRLFSNIIEYWVEKGNSIGDFKENIVKE